MLPTLQPTDFTLFEETPGLRMILLPDAPTFTIAAVTKDLCHHLSLEKEALTGRAVTETFPSDPTETMDAGRSELQASLTHVLLHKTPYELHIQRYDVKDDNGSFLKRLWRVRNHPVLDAEGNVVFIIHTKDDIKGLSAPEVKEQKVAGLAEAHQVLLQAPIAISMVRGNDFTIEIANEAALELWDKTDAIIGKPLLEALPEFKEQPIFEMIEQVFKTGDHLHTKEVPVFYSKKGESVVRYFDVYCKPYFVEGSVLVNGVYILFNEVTGKVRSEKIDAENEDKYSSLFQSMDQGFCVIEMMFNENSEPIDYRFLETNPVFEKQTGLKDAVGKTARQMVPDLEAHWFNLYGQVALTGKPSRFTEVSEAMGRWFEVYAYRSGGENSRRVALLFTDITAQKNADQKIIESEERFRTLADESPMFVFIIDADPLAPVSYWNKTWLQYTGQTAEEAHGRAWDGIIHPEDVPEVMKHYVPAFEKRVPYFIPSIRVKRHDGTFRWHAFKGNPRYLPDGDFNGYVGVGFDIHEQKVTEDLIYQNEARTRLAVGAAQLGTFEIDVAAQTMIYSERAAEIFGLDKAKHWPYTVFSDKIHPEDVASRNKAHALALETGDLFYEARIIHSNSNIYWIRINGRYVNKGATNNVLIGTVMDITEEKRAAEMLEQKIDERTRELQQVNEQLKQFTYSASHDLQEPLRKISFFLDRLLQNLGASVSDENKKIAERITYTTDRMRTLIDDLLAYSNTTLGATNTEKVSLTTVVKEVLDDMEVTLLEQEAVIKVEELPSVKGDHRQLRQLIQNLVSNAVKYRDKSRSPQVEISAKKIQGVDVDANIPTTMRSRPWHLITIADNGIGFHPDDAERIFRLFQRLHGKAEYDGTGIGLAIVQKVVENHQGFIWAEGEPGAGAKFNVVLPAD